MLFAFNSIRFFRLIIEIYLFIYFFVCFDLFIAAKRFYLAFHFERENSLFISFAFLCTHWGVAVEITHENETHSSKFLNVK